MKTAGHFCGERKVNRKNARNGLLEIFRVTRTSLSARTSKAWDGVYYVAESYYASIAYPMPCAEHRKANPRQDPENLISPLLYESAACKIRSP